MHQWDKIICNQDMEMKGLQKTMGKIPLIVISLKTLVFLKK